MKVNLQTHFEDIDHEMSSHWRRILVYGYHDGSVRQIISLGRVGTFFFVAVFRWAGVMLLDLAPEGAEQGVLFTDIPDDE